MKKKTARTILVCCTVAADVAFYAGFGALGQAAVMGSPVLRALWSGFFGIALTVEAALDLLIESHYTKKSSMSVWNEKTLNMLVSCCIFAVLTVFAIGVSRASVTANWSFGQLAGIWLGSGAIMIALSAVASAIIRHMHKSSAKKP